QRSKLRGLYDPSHRDYAKYEGLRTNIAVLRNDIIGQYLDDGSFDPGDEKYIPNIAGIAASIGDALGNDSWLKRPFTQSISTDVASVEGIGAREMYKYLLRIQTKPNMLRSIRAMLDIPDYSFGLPPLEKTPFSNAALAAPPPKHEMSFTQNELVMACASPEMREHLERTGAVNKPAGERLTDAGEALTATAGKLQAPHTLPPPTRDASVEEARTILRWLKNLQSTDRHMEEWLNH